MNRSLLLVVCDFLLLSILALARFDVPKDAILPEDKEKINRLHGYPYTVAERTTWV